MRGLFGFFDMVGTYAYRKVARYPDDDNSPFLVDTCSVTDGDHEFETAVQHPEYNGGKMVIVEAYDTKEEAQKGHNKWVKLMTSEVLPDTLVDCSNSDVGAMARDVGCEVVFKRNKK